MPSPLDGPRRLDRQQPHGDVAHARAPEPPYQFADPLFRPFGGVGAPLPPAHPQAGVVQSMDSVGDAYDNAMCETDPPKTRIFIGFSEDRKKILAFGWDRRYPPSMSIPST